MPNFSDILGQPAAVELIRRAYLANRLPHGLIFAGPSGVGKATTAGALGQLFLCEQPLDDRPCGRCPSCAVFASGNHPDFHVVTKELIRFHDKSGTSKGTTLSIQVIRPELIEPASRKAVMGRGKMFIIEQAELMQAAAQNAMLKTLEEPAGRTLIVLLTDDPDSLLQTIRSRSQVVLFAAMDVALVERELIARKIDSALARDAAKLSEGSLGNALKWIEDGVIAPARELIAQLGGKRQGRPLENLPGWFKAAAEAYAEKQLERDELASKDQANREGLALYLKIAANYFRSRLHAEHDPEQLDEVCGAIDAIARAERYLGANVNIPIVFQQLAMAIM